MKKRILSMALALLMMTPVTSQHVSATEPDNTIFINEIESSSAETNDYIELINTGKTDVDISGWFVSDNKELERLADGSTKRFIEGTIIKAGGLLVVELDQVGQIEFALGKNDSAVLYNANSEVVDSYTYEGHAVGTYSRVPDGTGEFTDLAPTKGALNIVDEPAKPEGTLVINEINSSPDDWVEVMNTGGADLDISGYEIRDNSDDHRWKFPSGTTVKAGELFLVKADSMGLIYNDATDSYEENSFDAALGIGSGDSIRLYDGNGNLLDSYSWTKHAAYDGDAAKASFGRYPDGTGSFCLMPETAGLSNTWYKPAIVINEVESDGDNNDWVEIYNNGSEAVDISGWYILDNDPVGHKADVTPVADGTVLPAGSHFVFEGNQHFTFGLGKNDSVTVFNKDGVVIDEYAWSGHAAGVYARVPDGTGEFKDFEKSTKGKANVIVNPVILNEIQSNDPAGGPDWIELANPTDEAIDISGIIIKDNDDAHSYIIPAGTTIEANGYMIFTSDSFGFGLGKNDSVRLFDNDLLIASATWTDHTAPTWGLYPDVKGAEYRNTSAATPGSANKFAGIPEIIDWPGDQATAIYDQEAMFLEDSSGLDFHNGQLYAVDNGTGKFWILDVSKDGKLTFAKGFEDGKRVRFQKDAGDANAAGPDAEGITVDRDGFVYLACERDNSAKGVNYNVILKADPKAEGSDLVAMKEWDLTASLPQVSANMGIESVEWVSDADLEGKLFDQNTGAAFDSKNYPNAVSNGVFFVALEDNGHVYAYVLNEDGSSVQIADIDSKLGGAMALDYDTYEDVLWAAADNGYKNMAAKMTFNGKAEPDIVHVKPATGVDTTRNYEGFAIASADYTVDGKRPVYRFEDGVKKGSLLIGSIDCDWTPQSDDDVQVAIIAGANGVWHEGSEEGLSFTSNATFDHFLKVQVDGKDLDGVNYEVKDGSTIVTLKALYLESLSKGKHTIGIVSDTGTAETSFTVAEKPDDGKQDKDKPDMNDGKQDGNTPDANDDVQDGDKPDTNDGKQDGGKPGTDGVQDGNKPGTDDGKQDGDKPGTDDGKQDGNKPGTDDGVQDNDTSDTDDGKQDGDKPGTDDGVQDGNTSDTNDGVQDGNTSDTNDGSVDRQSKTTPQTGSESDIGLWLALMLLSCGGIIGTVIYTEKKRAANR